VQKTGSSLAHNLYIKTGDPSKEIIKMAEKEQHDIILIGHRGMSDLEEFFIGSVAAKVVRHAPCDVLVHKP
jgi:nucleotide-binding universal stress UspA family protein